ncbi:MAG: SdrD B-like domain-containing protein [Pseudomonadota bacterium]
MTYTNYTFSAFSNASMRDGLAEAGNSAKWLKTGGSFEMPTSIDIEISISDNDIQFDSDNGSNGYSRDGTGQEATVIWNDRSVGNGGQLYLENVRILQGSDGNSYKLGVIKQEKSGVLVYSFIDGVPPEGTILTQTAVKSWNDVEYERFGSGGEEEHVACDDPNAVSIDFNALARGTVVDDEFDGVTVTALRNHRGEQYEGQAMVFDSSNPTGGDTDLATTTQGNVLIVSEDGDSNDPDDEGHGGTLIFDFANPAEIFDLKVIDTEEGGEVRLYDADGNLLESVAIPRIGDGEIAQVLLETTGVARMEVELNGSGAIDDICYIPGEPVEPAPATVGNIVFLDNNGNGVFDAGDDVVENVTVELLDENGSVVDTTTTDANGEYSFGGLDAGTYSVRFTPPEGLEFTTQSDAPADEINNDSDADEVTGETGQFELSPGEIENDIAAGLISSDPGTGSISGRYFMDMNDNSIDDAGDLPVVGGTVFLADASTGQVFRETTTDENGNYIFENLDAGLYDVRFLNQDEQKAFVEANVGDDDTIDSDVEQVFANGLGRTRFNVELDAGENVTDVDAGIEDLNTASLSGRFFMDNDETDTETDGDTGVANAVVSLFKAGVFVAETTTDANGDYSFTGLAAGNDYTVEFNNPTDKVFVAQDVGGDDAIDSDVDATGVTGQITVLVGEETPNVDAGIVEPEVVDPGNASIGDLVFLDNNRDGVFNAGDTGVGFATVNLFTAGDDGVFGTGDDVLEATQQTFFDGSYLFTGLSAGEYRVQFAAPAFGDFEFTTQGAGSAEGTNNDSDADVLTGFTDVIDLAIGEAELDVDAGLVIALDDPEPQPDTEVTCANEQAIVRVLENDNETGGDGLTVTSVNGMAIAEGETIDIDGVLITLQADGSLAFDGEGAFVGLDIGEETEAVYTYSVVDEFGSTASSDVSVTFKGVAETVAEIGASLPTDTIQFQVVDENTPAGSSDEAFTLKLTSGDVRLDMVYTEAYCVQILDPLLTGDPNEPIEFAPAFTGNIYVANSDAPITPALTTVGINGETAADNLDLINWILNQDFGGQGFSDGEIQAAIWSLTDGDVIEDAGFANGVFVADGAGEAEDALLIQQAALANGEGFEAGPGGVVGLLIDPDADSDAAGFEQPFIIAANFDDIDCIC